MSTVVATLRNLRVLTLMLGHFVVDGYGGVLPVLFPVLIQRWGLNLETVGLITLAYFGAASLSQPIFGMVADRVGTRWTWITLAWSASTFAVAGFMPSFALLLVAIAAAGLGSGAFHPFGALSVRALLPERGRNTAMSIYVSGGTIGVALGPLIGVLVFGLFGLGGTAVLLLPGLLIALYLVGRIGGRPEDREAAAAAAAERRSAPIAWAPLAVTVAIMMSRSWTMSTLQAFTPTWYHQLGYAPWLYGSLATTVILFSAAGSIGSGSLADRFGRRAVIIGSLVLSVPVIWLYVAFPGPQAFISGALLGLLAASTGPLMLVIAQDLMVGRAGMASGMILGLGFVTGGIGVPVTGALADHFGIQSAMYAQVALTAATIIVALLLPSEAYLRKLRLPREAEPALAAAPILGGAGD